MDGAWEVAREPLHTLLDSPDAAHNPPHLSATARARLRIVRSIQNSGVGPGVFFGLEMLRRSGVPQGLICTAHGGTSMSDWSPEKKALGGNSLYGSMLRIWSETAQPVAGVLWYQGESDTGNSLDVEAYTERMIRLVASIREDLNQTDLAFLMVQLGQYFTTTADQRLWKSIQIQQGELPTRVDHLGCVPAIDLPLDDAIHISSAGHARLGVRLARLAERNCPRKHRRASTSMLCECSPSQR